MSRSAKAAHGFATSLIQYGSQILVQALLAPVVLKVAGRETLGAYAAIMQTVGLLQLVDIAGSWSLERFLAQALGRDDGGTRFRNVFTTARLLFLICNTTLASLILIFSFLIGRMFHLTPDIALQARHALWVIAVWAICRTPLAAYASASIATQDLAATNLIGALLGAARAVASLLFVLAGGGLFGLMMAGTVVEASGYVLYRVRFKHVNPTLMPGWGIPDKPLLREMVGFGGHSMFLNIGNVLLFNSGNMVAGITNGAAVASGFYTSQMPTMTAYNMIQRLSDSATPAINELYGRGELERLRNAMMRLTRLMLALALPLATGVLLFNRDLVISWVGPKQYAGRLLTSSLAAFCLTFAVQRIAIVYSFVFGWMRLLSTTAFLQGLSYFGLAIYLGRHIGLGGITLALVLVVIPQNILLWQKIGKVFEMNVASFLANCMLKAAIPLAAASGLSWFVHQHVVIRQRHLGGFLAEALTFITIYSSLAYFLILQDVDRGDVNRQLRSVWNLGRNAQRKLASAVGST